MTTYNERKQQAQGREERCMTTYNELNVLGQVLEFVHDQILAALHGVHHLVANLALELVRIGLARKVKLHGGGGKKI